MLYYEKQPTGESLQKLTSFLNAAENGAVPEGVEPELQGDFSRLGNVPIGRERTLVEELFSFDGPPDATVSVGGEEYYYFAGEGYLGLQANPEVLAATCEAVLRYGTSLGTTRRRFTPAPIFEVERQSAAIYRTDKALYCPSETGAIERILESAADSFDVVFLDELCSDVASGAVASVLARRCKAPVLFRHRDVNHLRTLLMKKIGRGQRPLVVTEGVFNAVGTIAPLPDYYALLSEYPESALLIDDSEGIGILGQRGVGTLDYFDYDTAGVNRTREDSLADPTDGLDYYSISEDEDEMDDLFAENDEDDFSEGDEGNVTGKSEENPGDFGDLFDDGFQEEEELPETDHLSDDFIFLDPEEKETATPKLRPIPVRTYLVASLARAIGGFGAVIPGSERFIDRLKDSARPFQSFVLPPTPMAAATAKGLQLSFHHDAIRHRLWNNVYYFKSELKKMGLPTEENMVPVVSLQTGSDRNMRRIQRELIDQRILVSYLQRLSVHRGQGSIRIALFATHQRAMIDLFLEILRETL